MNYAAQRNNFVSHKASSKDEAATNKAGILRRIFDVIMESRQRAADRQIARFLAARSGGRLTDNLEREMTHRLLTSNWSLNADPFNRRFP